MTSGVALYHIPKNLVVDEPREKNPSSNIWDGETNTSPLARVCFVESVSAPMQNLIMVKKQRVAQRKCRPIWFYLTGKKGSELLCKQKPGFFGSGKTVSSLLNMRITDGIIGLSSASL